MQYLRCMLTVLLWYLRQPHRQHNKGLCARARRRPACVAGDGRALAATEERMQIFAVRGGLVCAFQKLAQELGCANLLPLSELGVSEGARPRGASRPELFVKGRRGHGRRRSQTASAARRRGRLQRCERGHRAEGANAALQATAIVTSGQRPSKILSHVRIRLYCT